MLFYRVSKSLRGRVDAWNHKGWRWGWFRRWSSCECSWMSTSTVTIFHLDLIDRVWGYLLWLKLSRCCISLYTVFRRAKTTTLGLLILRCWECSLDLKFTRTSDFDVMHHIVSTLSFEQIAQVWWFSWELLETFTYLFSLGGCRTWAKQRI